MEWIWAFLAGGVVGAFGMAFACNKWEWLARKIVRESNRIVGQAEDLAKKAKG